MKLLIHSQTSTAAAAEVWERINNFIPHIIMDAITYAARGPPDAERTQVGSTLSLWGRSILLKLLTYVTVNIVSKYNHAYEGEVTSNCALSSLPNHACTGLYHWYRSFGILPRAVYFLKSLVQWIETQRLTREFICGHWIHWHWNSLHKSSLCHMGS